MILTIELSAGPRGQKSVTKNEIQKNIDALQRAVDGKMMCSDDLSIMDTISILEGIQNKLPTA
ncbi:hypothetical protein KAR91_15625 [Candidatus Pacearchaeota archaeon]|nr:hypothetical protein [Candidatus Pacearchaeota archaeon]